MVLRHKYYHFGILYGMVGLVMPPMIPRFSNIFKNTIQEKYDLNMDDSVQRDLSLQENRAGVVLWL